MYICGICDVEIVIYFPITNVNIYISLSQLINNQIYGLLNKAFTLTNKY